MHNLQNFYVRRVLRTTPPPARGGQRSKVKGQSGRTLPPKKKIPQQLSAQKKTKTKIKHAFRFHSSKMTVFVRLLSIGTRPGILSKLINIPEYGVNAQCKQLCSQNHHSLRVIIPVDTCFVHAGDRALLGLLSLSIHTVVKVMHV